MSQLNAIPLNSPDGSLWGEFLHSFLRLQGLILALVGIAVGIVVWWFTPQTQVRVAWVWIVVLVSVVIIWLLVDVARRLFNRPIHFLPKVVTSIESNGLSQRPILILERSDLFGHGSLVSMFFIDDNGIELQAGSGQVLTIQTDRRIQVEVTHWATAHVAVLDRVKSGSSDTLARLLVKPSVTHASMQGNTFEAVGGHDEVEVDQEVSEDVE